MSKVSMEEWAMMDVEWATSPWRRFRGLLFGVQNAEILALADCRDVHTFGMRQPIDIAFVGETGVVIDSYRNVHAGARLRCPQAHVVFERYSNEKKPWVKKGDVFDARLLSSELRTLPRENGR